KRTQLAIVLQQVHCFIPIHVYCVAEANTARTLSEKPNQGSQWPRVPNKEPSMVHLSLHALTRTYTTCVDAHTITHAHELRASEIVSEQASEFPHLRNLGSSKSSPRKERERGDLLHVSICQN